MTPPADEHDPPPPARPAAAPAAAPPPIPIPPPIPVDAVMLERRAQSFTRRSIKTEAKRSGLRLAMSMVDLTTLEGKDSPEKVRALCRKAVQPCDRILDDPVPPVAAVCVYPALTPVAAETLAGTDVTVASVATAFPSGQYPLDGRLDDVRAAIAAGADEIDMVINRGAFLRGDLATVAEEIAAITEVCRTTVRGDRHGPGAPNGQPPPHRTTHLKIILETGELETYEHVRRASDLAIAASSGTIADADWEDGAVFIKTSTGKVAPAATLPVTLVMLEAIRDHFLRTGRRVGMKPAGGIRTAKQALQYLVLVNETLGPAWLSPHLFRFGASSLANDLVRQILAHEDGTYVAPFDVTEG